MESPTSFFTRGSSISNVLIPHLLLPEVSGNFLGLLLRETPGYTTWQSVWTAIPNGTPLTVARFEQALKDFIAKYAGPDDRAHQIDYLRNLKKPHTIPCQQLQILFENLNSMADWLPGTNAVLADSDLKRAYYNAMPQKWQQHYVKAGKNVERDELNSLRTYFAALEDNALKSQIENNKRSKKQVGQANPEAHNGSGINFHRKGKRSGKKSSKGNDGPFPNKRQKTYG